MAEHRASAERASEKPVSYAAGATVNCRGSYFPLARMGWWV
jgi:hypothetical protein